MLFDGSSMILVNGEVVGQAAQFSLLSVEVTVATVVSVPNPPLCNSMSGHVANRYRADMVPRISRPYEPFEARIPGVCNRRPKPNSLVSTQA
jgi:hypothetical protein